MLSFLSKIRVPWFIEANSEGTLKLVKESNVRGNMYEYLHSPQEAERFVLQ